MSVMHGHAVMSVLLDKLDLVANCMQS